MRGPVGPLLKFRNHSLLVTLSGGVKELRVFQRFCTSLAPLACIQPGPAHLVDVRPSLWCLPLGASPKFGRLVKHWVDDRPESATTRLDLSWLLSWRCTLRALLECDCYRELSQIQASSLNSLKFSILQIRPGPFLNVT